MVLFDLPHVIVGDTTKSIKPIGSKGCLFQKVFGPIWLCHFYVEGVLREVVIFCSTRPNNFNEPELATYLGMAECLWKELPLNFILIFPARS